MSACDLLNLLNKSRKSDEMRGLPYIVSLFRDRFNKFNNTGTRTVDSIYHMALNLLKNLFFFWRETSIFLLSFTQRDNGRFYVTLLICKVLVVYRYYCMV